MSEISNNNIDYKPSNIIENKQNPKDFANQIKTWKENAKKAEFNDPDGKYDDTKLSSIFDEQFNELSYNPIWNNTAASSISEALKSVINKPWTNEPSEKAKTAANAFRDVFKS